MAKIRLEIEKAFAAATLKTNDIELADIIGMVSALLILELQHK